MTSPFITRLSYIPADECMKVTFLVILLIEKKVAFSMKLLKHTKQMGLLFQEKINTAGESFYSSFHYCVKVGYLLVFFRCTVHRIGQHCIDHF